MTMGQTYPQQQQQPQQSAPSASSSSAPSGTTPGLQYIDIDFSPGIHSDLYGNTPATPDGAATTATYGCFSPPAGGLAPLPRASTDPGDTLVVTPSQIANGATLTQPGYRPAANDASHGNGRMFVIDAIVHGPLSNNNLISTQNGAMDVPVVLFGYSYNSAGTSGGTSYSVYTSLVRKFPGWSVRATTNEMLVASTEALIVPSGNLQISTSATGSGHHPTILGLVGHSTTNLNPTADVYYPCRYFALPDPTSLAATAPYTNTLFTDGAHFIAGVFLIAHQGRIILLCNDAGASSFTVEADYYHPEQLMTAIYGKFNIAIADMSGPLVVVEENPSGISAWGTISANQIILVKNQGGGVEITGSVDNPTVLRLPGIRGTGGLPSIAASVPGHNFRYPGIVYGTSQGVFMWAGVDNSEAISNNLDPLFWLWNRNWTGAQFGSAVVSPGGTNTFYGMYGPLGRFGYVHPFLFAPNSYVCDFRSDAWWQIDNPANTVHFTHWQPSSRAHKIWGFRGYVDDTNTTVGQVFDLDKGQGTYFYESHPFKPSRNRYIECREILCSIVGRTNDTVVVALVGHGGTKTYTMTLTQDGLSMFRLDASLIASFVQARITSTSNNSDAAPRVLACSIGYRPQTIIN